MFIQDVIVSSNKLIADNTYIIEVRGGDLVDDLKPGQFFNILVNESSYPLLRRPFSICDVRDDSILFMYKIVGEGTAIIAGKKPGNKINLLGPLGNSFEIKKDTDHLIILGGGIGIAPFPFLIRTLHVNLSYSVLFGVRNKKEAHSFGLNNIIYSSDDGSIGLNGNVIQLLENHLSEIKYENIQIVACGPNAMFRSLGDFVKKRNLDCTVSMESAMACGFGICQGCPIEYKNDETYKLICKDGPVFNIQDIKI